MTINEYWIVCAWSDMRGEWCEQHEDYPTKEEAINSIKNNEYKGFFKVEQQFQVS